LYAHDYVKSRSSSCRGKDGKIQSMEASLALENTVSDVIFTQFKEAIIIVNCGGIIGSCGVWTGLQEDAEDHVVG
jgi:hypothetical protein